MAQIVDTVNAIAQVEITSSLHQAIFGSTFR